MNIALAAVIFLLVALGGFALGTRPSPFTTTPSTDTKIETTDNATTTIVSPNNSASGTPSIQVNGTGDLKVNVVPLDTQTTAQ